MANVLDEFVGTAGTLLTAHAADTGGVWTVPASGTSWTIGPSGEAYSAPSFTTRCFPPAAPAGADVTVKAKFKRVTDVASINGGIFARGDTTTTLNGYFLRYIRSTSLWRVDKIVAGTTTTLGSSAATPVNGTVYQLELSCVGTTITGKVDGVTVWTGTDASLTSGVTGVIGGGAASSATTGMHLTDFEQVDAITNNAGADQVDVEPYATVTLTGVGPGPWSQTGGTPTVTLGGSGTTRTFEAPATMNGTTLTFTYGTDTMTVTVLPHNEWWRSGSTWAPLRIVA